MRLCRKTEAILRLRIQTLQRQKTIPACAGEPAVWPDTLTLVEDYPRVCGGTEVRRPSTDFLKGLSPRVRGNLR